MKRILAIVLIILLLAAGCAKKADTAAEAPEETQAPVTEAEAVSASKGSAKQLLGFVIDDDGSIPAYMSMHGFLRTAENMGYPAKLYRAENGEASVEAVRQAAAEGCRGLLIFNKNGVNNAAVEFAAQSGLKVVVPYFECNAVGLNANVVADTTEYVEELARGLAARMGERSLKSGKILVYGVDISTCYEAFVQAINQYYPQYTVASFVRTAADTQGAIDELAQFLLYNRDIKGLYVVDSEQAAIAVQARSAAQSIFRKEGAPSPTPSPKNAPDTTLGTPQPTPNPGLLTAITVTIFASGLSDENYKLFNDDDIYALCIEPYYESATQAAMYLDKLLRGEEVAAVSRVNRPIAYADTIEKYTAIFDEAKEMFGIS